MTVLTMTKEAYELSVLAELHEVSEQRRELTRREDALKKVAKQIMGDREYLRVGPYEMKYTDAMTTKINKTKLLGYIRAELLAECTDVHHTKRFAPIKKVIE